MSDARDIAIVGVGETEFLRRSPDDVSALVVQAARAACGDAGIDPAEIDGFVTEASSMPSLVPADVVAEALGVRDRRFTASALIGGAGVVGAPALARLAIQSGQASVVLSYFGADFGSSVGGPYAFPAAVQTKEAVEKPVGWYGQPLLFAALAQRYAYEFGLTPDQQAAVAISNRSHASRTPGAMRRDPITIDDYLCSPMVAEPFRVLDCSLVNDGAVAFLMTSAERARDLRKPPVRVAGIGTASYPTTQSSYFSQKPDYLRTPATLTAEPALVEAGVRRQDIDLAEIYDCFTISLILQMEDLGLAERGGGAHAFVSGSAGPGGALPVNTHGGLLSHSYTVGAGHVVEAVRQLRGERHDNQVHGAEVALVAGLGVPDHATLVLTVDH